MKIIYTLLLMLLISENGICQDDKRKVFIREKGLLLGLGYGIDGDNIPEGSYNPVFFIAHLGIGFAGKAEFQKPSKGIFTLYFEPQVNPVFIKSPERTVNDLEFGVNVGVKHMFPILPNLYSFISIGVGPHFTSVHTTKQKRGFLFSDNLGTGLYFFVKDNLAINLTFRLRHLSNGDTMKPNMGINTFNYHIGISKVLK